ncbi:hypothetical protein [Prosthecobacter sp.]|jgi:hypothetical protein|uniref:hypothetical protein n=1 Tax=Prosthecobacter sp. TaxID=1965333 RepID=UPI0037843F20
MVKLSRCFFLTCLTVIAWGQTETVVNLLDLDAPVGSLEYASIHEAGHVVCATSAGMSVTRAVVFQRSKPGVGVYWKGATTLRGSSRHHGMAMAKLGGNFAEFFLADRTNTIRVPSFLDVVGNRRVISQSDVITAEDLGGESLLTIQNRTYRALAGNVSLLNRVYQRLRTSHVYP